MFCQWVFYEAALAEDSRQWSMWGLSVTMSRQLELTGGMRYGIDDRWGSGFSALRVLASGLIRV